MPPVFSVAALEQAQPTFGYSDGLVVDDDCLHTIMKKKQWKKPELKVVQIFCECTAYSEAV